MDDMRSQDRALHYSALRGKNTEQQYKVRHQQNAYEQHIVCREK